MPFSFFATKTPRFTNDVGKKDLIYVVVYNNCFTLAEVNSCLFIFNLLKTHQP